MSWQFAGPTFLYDSSFSFNIKLAWESNNPGEKDDANRHNEGRFLYHFKESVRKQITEMISAYFATLLKERLWHRCFPVNFTKFLRISFLQNTSGRLLLHLLNLHLNLVKVRISHTRGLSLNSTLFKSQKSNFKQIVYCKRSLLLS